jgi:chromatin segregation and condensation protein Rec8/ScpA/Scc1 (kleisin family)
MTTEALSRVFAALADPTRRDMVARLAEGDATANQLAEPYQITRPPGPQPRPVRLEVHVFDLMDNWIERHRRRAEQRYRRLDALLAEMSGDEA